MIATHVEHLQHVLSELLMEEFEAQGHSMTGKLIKDIEYKVKQETTKLTLSGYAYIYGNILAAGTKAAKIPYGGRTGRGGTSLYILALQNYVKQRMNIQDEQKSKSIAFAIATEQKKHGMPTPGSHRFTTTGKRTDFVEEAFRKGEDRITEAVSQMAFNLLTVNFDVLLNKWQTEINAT